jgi:hypothetical protein
MATERQSFLSLQARSSYSEQYCRCLRVKDSKKNTNQGLVVLILLVNRMSGVRHQKPGNAPDRSEGCGWR